jgi:hypothetical protein
VGKSEGNRSLGRPDVGESITLKLILEEYEWVLWIGLK